MKNTKILGFAGETLVAKHLEKNGYKIIAKNYTNSIGEIDIIAKQNNTLVFVEVKTRSSVKFGAPQEAVTPAKQNKIRNVALAYLKQTKNFAKKLTVKR